MQAQAQTPSATETQAHAGPGHDLYAGIHKALRLFMTRTLTRVGSTDASDAAELAASLQQVEALLAQCESHLQHENHFVHPALEAARAGSAARIAAEHVHHEENIADLRDLVSLVAHSSGAARPAALHRLYHALALFVADNLQHMHVEETAHNALLWQAYSDAELLDLEQRIIESIPPAEMAASLHWFIPALSAPERAGMLGGMRQGLPAGAFAGVLGIAESTLGAASFARLQRDLRQLVSA